MNPVNSDDHHDLQEVITPLTVLDTASLHLVRDPSVIDMASSSSSSVVMDASHHHHHHQHQQQHGLHSVSMATEAEIIEATADNAGDVDNLTGTLTTATGGAVEAGTAVLVAGTDALGNATSQVGVIDADGNISLLSAEDAAAALTGHSQHSQLQQLHQQQLQLQPQQQQQQPQQQQQHQLMQQILVSNEAVEDGEDCGQIVHGDNVHSNVVNSSASNASASSIPFSIADIVNQTIKEFVM